WSGTPTRSTPTWTTCRSLRGWLVADAAGRAVPAPPQGYKVADLCRRWLVGQDKVLGFIRKGELVAVNVATCLSGRPQWRVTAESGAACERRRRSAPPPKPQRRRRQTGTDYFPD